jgi:hypothetical protein
MSYPIAMVCILAVAFVVLVPFFYLLSLVRESRYSHGHQDYAKLQGSALGGRTSLPPLGGVTKRWAAFSIAGSISLGLLLAAFFALTR